MPVIFPPLYKNAIYKRMIYTYTSLLRTGSTWEVMQFRKRGWASCILNLRVKETRTEWYDLALKSLINYIVYPYRQFCLLENNRVKNYAQIHSTSTINLDSRDDWSRSSRIPRTRKTRLLARRRGTKFRFDSSRSPRRQEEAIAREDRSSGCLFDSGRGRTERCAPKRQSPRRERILSSFSETPSLRTLFHPSPHAAPQVRGATKSRSRLAHQFHSPHTLVVLLGFSSTHTSSCVSIEGAAIKACSLRSNV